MRNTNGTFPGTAPLDMDTVIDEVQAEYPSLAYAGPVETDRAKWTEDQLDAMGEAILAGLVSGMP